MRVAFTLLPAFLAPVLDGGGLVSLDNIGDLQVWINLGDKKKTKLKRRALKKKQKKTPQA